MQLSANTFENPYEGYDSRVKCKLPNLTQEIDNLNKAIAMKEKLIASTKKCWAK